MPAKPTQTILIFLLVPIHRILTARIRYYYLPIKYVNLYGFSLHALHSHICKGHPPIERPSGSASGQFQRWQRFAFFYTDGRTPVFRMSDNNNDDQQQLLVKMRNGRSQKCGYNDCRGGQSRSKGNARLQCIMLCI